MRLVKNTVLGWTAVLSLATLAWAGTFGKVVTIGGHASDVALDERRGLVYLANFTANRIEVISTATQQLQAPIKVPAQPASLALSPDGRFLVVAHYAKWAAPSTNLPAITILDLDGGLRTTLALGASPLAVAFGGGNLALVVSEGDQEVFQLLDPTTGTFVADLTGQIQLDAMELPVPFGTFPPQITQATVGVSGDKRYVIGLAEGQIGNEAATLRFRYDTTTQVLEVIGITAAPPLGPRVVSVDGDGSLFLLGWALFDTRDVLMAQFPYPDGRLNAGSHAFDFSRGLIYAQIPEGAEQVEEEPEDPTAPEEEEPTPAPLGPPVLHIVDSDNLTVRERIQLPEHLAGKGVLNSDFQTMYAVSDSGLMILPVGSIGQTRRLAASQEDVVFRGNFCDRRVFAQEIDIVNPGGGPATDFRLSTTTQGITISPSSGVTPARVRISVDPNVFQNQKGTTTAFIEISSNGGVNIPLPVRVLINTREPEQRGAFINVPGKIVDVLADPVRNRFYLVRQDRNQVLVFDGAGFSQIANFRTGNTPTHMAITRDARFLIVGNDNSQIANVYDLDALAPSEPIIFPFGHYPRTIAASNTALLATSRGVGEAVGCPEGPGLHAVDRIDFDTRTASSLPSLGIYCNDIDVDTVLAPSPSGSLTFAAMSNGTVLLYEADADTFVASRQDLTALSGVLAAVSDDVLVVGNHILNRSLVPVATLETTTGSSSGFSFAEGLGLRTTAPSASSPGVIQRVNLTLANSIRPTKMVEAPLLVDSLITPRVGQIGQTILPFVRTLAPLSNGASIVSLTVSGFTILPNNFDAALAQPVIQSVVNLADQTPPVAPGGLISISGTALSSVTASNQEIPVPTTLGEACLTVNGVLAPMLFASPGRISAQLPFEVGGAATMILRTPGGTSNPFLFTIFDSAPAIFHDGTAGPRTGLPAVFRATNNMLVTLSNPIHPEDYITIFLTGLGRTSPSVATGAAAPGDPLAEAIIQPDVRLGGVGLPVTFAGLVPGQVGVYQINAFVPHFVPTGMQVPLTIGGGPEDLTLNVRVVR